MITNEMLNTIRATSMYAFFALRETACRHVEKLAALVDEERFSGENKPKNTVAAFVEEVGRTRAKVIIATLVNARAWDGRIYRGNALWAKNVRDAFDEEAAMRLDMLPLADTIHTAHLDQLCDEIREMIS